MSSTGFTNNAALAIAKWFTSAFGMGLPWSGLDEDSVIAAANVCDERVLVQTRSSTATADPATDKLTPSAGARVLDWGDGIRFTSSGTLPAGIVAATTYYAIPSDGGTFKIASSVANAFAGTAIDLTTAGTGTLTVLLYDEARYKLNGAYALDTPKGEVRKQLLSAMAGVAVYIGGKWFLHAGAAALPTVTLDEDDLRGEMTWIPKRSMRDRFNGVKAVYVNPSANWQPVDAPPLQSAAYLAEDDGEELFEDIRLPFTTSTPTAQRLMKIALEQNRQQGIVHFPAKLTAMRLQPWDGVYLSIERYGWVQKQFRVIGWMLAEDGGIDLTLQEDDASVYAWTADEETAAALQQGVVLPNPSVIAAPASIIVDTPIEPTYSRLNATIAEVKSIWFDGYDVEFKPDAFTNWSSNGRLYTNLISIVTSEAVDIQARAVTKNGTPSEFTQNNAPGIPTDFAVDGMDPLKLTWTNGAGAAQVQVFQGTGDFDSSTLLDTVDVTGATDELVVPDDNFYWLRSVNAQGNISAATTSVEVGTPGPVEGGGDGGGEGDSGSDGGADGGDGDA